MSLSGRHIVITGGSTGIGRATAAALVREGARVTLIARSVANLAAACTDLGDAARFAVADVGDRAALLAALDAAEALHGPIDGLFCNAGTGGSFAPTESYDAATFDSVMAINLSSAFWAIAQVLPGMKARGSGAILVTGSLASERGMANNAAYVASKHGLIGLMRGVALEGAPHGVRCNAVIPGFIETPMLDALPDGALDAMAAATPQGRTGTAAEVAEVAAFLLSDAASHVTGQSLAVDGGVLGTLRI